MFYIIDAINAEKKELIVRTSKHRDIKSSLEVISSFTVTPSVNNPGESVLIIYITERNKKCTIGYFLCLAFFILGAIGGIVVVIFGGNSTLYGIVMGAMSVYQLQKGQRKFNKRKKNLENLARRLQIGIFRNGSRASGEEEV
eukprot:snap_masked-scaffold_103-processed-gene-0.0-mRNA-1 protein AED:1.00 eAED:1.00 QI:0/-1/0/0/-1/1/1/0/141